MSNFLAAPCPDSAPIHDVVVLGVHLTSALLAAALARHGVDVVLVPTTADDNSAAGETTVPYTAELLGLIGTRYRLPEVTDLATFATAPQLLRRTSGVKRNLGFLYHHRGQQQNPQEAVQFRVPGEHAEWHPYRPDLDTWAAALAVTYGADRHSSTGASAAVGTEQITVTCTDGTVVRGRYLVDASGLNLATTPRLAAAAPRPQHQTRLMTTHMSGVVPFAASSPASRYAPGGDWHAGTLLHVFDGGWLQVAEFGNHPDSINPLTSVSLSLDPNRYPDTGADPDEQFHRIIADFPELAAQFAVARRTRPWHTDSDATRLPAADWQPRLLRFDRGAARHDLLLSRELTAGLELTHAAAAGLLKMADADDWAGPHMADFTHFQAQLLAYHDRFIAAARTASRDFALFNAFLRGWLLWSILSALALKRARLDAAAVGGWDRVERYWAAPFWYAVPEGLPPLLEQMLTLVEQVQARASTPADAAAAIFQRLTQDPVVPPLYRFGDPTARYYRFTLLRRLRMLMWVKTTAPASFRRLLTPENVTAQARALRT